MYINKRNNVRLKIKNTLTAIWNLLILENHKLLWDDFANDVTKEYNLTLVKYSWTSPIQMEIVRVKSKSWDKFIIERAVEACPLNYNASENTQSSLEFSIWDVAIQALTASEINSLAWEVRDKISKGDTSITKQWNDFNSWNQLLKLDWNWRVPEGNLPPMNININWLPKTDFKWNMSLIAYDNETQRNYKFPTNHISERFDTIENNMRNKSAIIQTDITRERYPETGNIDGKEITINHNLGVIPKMIQVLGNNFEWFWSNWKQIWKVAHTDIGVDRVFYSDENTPRNEAKMVYTRVNNDSDMIWIVEVWTQHIVIKAKFGLTLRNNSREALQWKIVFLLTN